MKLRDEEVALIIRQRTEDLEYRNPEHQALNVCLLNLIQCLGNVNQCLDKVNRAADQYINRSEL